MDLERAAWWCGGVGLVAALLWPLVVGRDGFPLSNYPMFSGKKQAQAKVSHVVVRWADGTSQAVAPAMLGTREIMQASQIARAAAKDGARANDLCARVAERVVADEAYAGVVAVEVRTDDYDTIAYWAGDRQPRKTKVHARCEPPSGERASR
jgi:hypothetical protein